MPTSAAGPEPVKISARAGRILLIACAGGLIVLLCAAGWVAVWPQRQNRIATAVRHAARMDPQAIEPGVTPADLALPAGVDPTPVRVGIYVDRIVDLSVKDASWTVDFYVWFRWRGDAIQTGDSFQVVDGWMESKVNDVTHTSGDEHYERYRVVAKISKSFDVSRFPCDDHLLTLNIECPAYLRQRLLFIPDEDNSSVSSRVELPAYAIHHAQIIEKPHSYRTARGDPRLPPGVKSTYSQCRLGIGIRRTSWGYYFKMFQSLYVAVAIALLALFVKPTNVDPRFGLGVGGLFAAVANSYITSSLIPDTGVMTLTDVVNGIGIATILLTVIQSTVSLYLFEQCGAEMVSRRLDRLCFAILAAGYLALNFALPLAACYRM